MYLYHLYVPVAMEAIGEPFINNIYSVKSRLLRHQTSRYWEGGGGEVGNIFLFLYLLKLKSPYIFFAVQREV